MCTEKNEVNGSSFVRDCEIKDDKIVKGYIRNYKALLMSIPIDVIKLVISFYHIAKDQIDTKNLGDCHTIQHVMKHAVIKHKQSHQPSTTIFCREISTGRHKWCFKLKRGDNDWMMIGIWKSKTSDKPKDEWFTLNKEGYAYHVGRGHLASDITSFGFGKIYGLQCQEKDIIEMIVDLDKNTLSYNVNCKDYGVAYDIDHDLYKAAIMTSATDDCIEFLGYRKM